jgi:hypothetical protein
MKNISPGVFCLCSLDFPIRFAQNVAEQKKLMRISLLAASGDWVQVVNTEILSFFVPTTT